MLGRGTGSAQPVEQDPAHLGTDPPNVLTYDGERRLDQVGHREVVEADEGDLVDQSRGPQGTDGSDGDDVASGKDRGRRVGQLQQPRHHLGGLVLAADAVDEQRGIEGDPCLLDRRAVPRSALHGRLDVVQVAQHCDPAVSTGGEMGGRGLRAAVGGDSVGVAVQAVWRTVHEDDGKTGAVLTDQVFVAP